MTTTARPSPTIARLLLSAAAVALALAAVGARPAAAAHASAKKSASPCWLQIINDWVPDGKVNGVYPIPCYRQAISHLNAYSDVKGYSSAVDDIKRAQQQAIRDKRNGVTPTTTGTDGGTSTIPGGGGKDGGDSSGGGGKGFFQSIADRLGPGNAQSIPLPLLVLGGLALLLLLAALATWLARRVQARRVTPAPAPAQRR
jgi:hypothetical protein